MLWMMKYVLVSFVCFCFVSVRMFGTDWNVYVAPYKYDKACALTYTFDDGLIEHYTLAAPELEKRGFRGTFFINGSKVNEDHSKEIDKSKPRVSWKELKEMAARGHEISSHGWAHLNVTKYPLEIIKEEVQKNDSAIYVRVGMMPRTYAYPGNRKGGEAMAFITQNRVGTRMEQRSLGSKRTSRDLEKWMNMLINTGDWGVTMTHGITYGYDAFPDPQVLWEHFDWVKAHEDKIWVGTFCEVAAYLKEKEAIRLKVISSKNGLRIYPALSLDKTLFTEPLTLVIEEENIKKAVVWQGKKKLSVTQKPGKIWFEFNPFGDEIRVKFK